MATPTATPTGILKSRGVSQPGIGMPGMKSEAHVLSDETLLFFPNRGDSWDSLVVKKCIKEIYPSHLRNMADTVTTLKFTHMNTFKNLKTLLHHLPRVHTLLFVDACFDHFKSNNMEKMVYHENITHIIIHSSTTISTKEHWIIQFLFEEINFSSLLSLRIQKFYPAKVITGEVEHVMQKYMTQIDDYLVTKFMLKNRHNLRELELGGPGLKIGPGSIGEWRLRPKENTSSQYEPVEAKDTGLQYESANVTTETQYDREVSHNSMSQTEAFKDYYKALMKAGKRSKMVPTHTFSQSNKLWTELLPPPKEMVNSRSMRVINKLSTDEFDPLEDQTDKIRYTPEGKLLGATSSSTNSESPVIVLKEHRKKKKQHPDQPLTDQENSGSTSTTSSGLKSDQTQEEGLTRTMTQMKATETSGSKRDDISKLDTLTLESFMFSFDAPETALQVILSSQQALRSLICVHVFLLPEIVVTASVQRIRSVMRSISLCIENNAKLLTEVTLDPIMITDFSRDTLREAAFLNYFEINCSVFKACSSLRILRLGLHAFRSVADLGVPTLATLMGTKVTALDQIPTVTLRELSVAVEDYSLDEFERFAKHFASFINLRILYFGTSTLKSENTFLVRQDYLQKLFFLPVIQTITFYNGKLENPESVKKIIDSYPNGAVITIKFDYQRFIFEFERNFNGNKK